MTDSPIPTESNKFSRRKVLAGLGATMALAAAAPFASFAQAPLRNTTSGAPDMSDPRSKYPKPPFAPQE